MRAQSIAYPFPYAILLGVLLFGVALAAIYVFA